MHSTQTLLRAQRGAGEANNREEIKKAISQNGDAVALLGHASHELSLFRRSSITPSLEQGYLRLCSDKVPVTKFLFGDNLADSMKEVQETNKLCSRISQHAKTTPSHGGKQYHSNKGYYKKSNKNHFLGQNYHGQSCHRGRGRGANNKGTMARGSRPIKETSRSSGRKHRWHTLTPLPPPPPRYALTTRHSCS